MSIYTTPLQFGYFLALAMALLFWIRGIREERLSDKMLGWVMFFLAMEIQDYTFGFAGINFLWEEMNGFPRGVALLFGPAIYYYLRAQTNRSFKFTKKHLLELLPWFIPFVVNLIVFLNGKDALQWWQSLEMQRYLNVFYDILRWASYIYYFYKSTKLYHNYRTWSAHQFSDTEIISFRWFRNFVYIMILGIVFKESIILLDRFFVWDFYQDWWWNLGLVAVIFYTGIWGYSQQQPDNLQYDNLPKEDMQDIENVVKEDLSHWKNTIEKFMQERKPYLEPQLNLTGLAKKMNINPGLLSMIINQNFNKNFNDFINEYRIEEYLLISKEDKNKQYTILGMALDCGFNSKSTFNRAFKKYTGKAPSEV